MGSITETRTQVALTKHSPKSASLTSSATCKVHHRDDQAVFGLGFGLRCLVLVVVAAIHGRVVVAIIILSFMAGIIADAVGQRLSK